MNQAERDKLREQLAAAASAMRDHASHLADEHARFLGVTEHLIDSIDDLEERVAKFEARLDKHDAQVGLYVESFRRTR